MKKLIVIIVTIIVGCSITFSQIEKQTSNLHIEGQIMASANAHALFINLGGPSVKFGFPKATVGITLYPTFKFENAASKLVISPVLGVGPQLNFLKDKRFILAFPCYYYASKNFWTATAGFGYVLTKPKK